MILAAVAAVIAPMLAVTVHDVLRRPELRRLGLRNLVRRPAEVALVAGGCALGTAIIAAGLVVSDTLDASIRDEARIELGPIDVVVRAERSAVADGAAGALAGTTGIDGVLRVRSSTVAVSAGGATVPDASVVEVDVDAARRFGGDVASTGLRDAGPTPRAGEVLLGAATAAELGVAAGDRIEVHVHRATAEAVVGRVLAPVGLAGRYDVVAGPGRLLPRGAATGGARPPSEEVLISATGGVFPGGAALAVAAGRAGGALARGAAAEVLTVKDDLLRAATDRSATAGQLFTSLGAFSLLAAVLLLVNLIAALAEERRPELGVLRALGLRRSGLARSFAVEGSVLAVAACATGALLGIGVGAAVVALTRSVLAGGDDDLRVAFHAELASLVTGAAIALVASLVTVWVASCRVARLEVVRAIRDLPAPEWDGRRRPPTAVPLVGVLTGIGAAVAGAAGGAPVGVVAGPALAALAAIPLLRRRLARRAAVAAGGSLAFAWAALAFTLVPAAGDNPDMGVFVVQGIVMVAAAVLVLAQADRGWGAVAGRAPAGPRGLALRLALTYPSSRPGRTAIQIAMLALVVFTMTLMAVFDGLYATRAGHFVERVRGRSHLYIDANPSSPLRPADLEVIDGVAGAVVALRAVARFETAFAPDPTPWPMTGIDEDVVHAAAPVLSALDPRFPTPAAAWRAVLQDPSLAVVPDFFLHDGGGPPPGRLRPGDDFTVLDLARGAPRRLTVAAVTDNDWIGNGVLVSRAALGAVAGAQATAGRAYVRVDPGADPVAVAAAIDHRLVDRGAVATTVDEAVGAAMAHQRGFFGLLEGYLGLGLLIGVAGLGVVMVRAVRERRRHLGTLRALGIRPRVLRRAFLLEAAFVAGHGVALGVVLGLWCGDQVLTRSDAFGNDPLPFAVPWPAVAVLLLGPTLAALAAAVVPARTAGRVAPADALRAPG